MAESMASTEARSSVANGQTRAGAAEHASNEVCAGKDVEDGSIRKCGAPASPSHAAENGCAVAYHILSPCASEVSLAHDHITCVKQSGA